MHRDDAVLVAAKAVLDRLYEVYRPEYIARTAEREPESLLGRAKALERALVDVALYRVAPPISVSTTIQLGDDPDLKLREEYGRVALQKVIQAISERPLTLMPTRS